MHCTNQGSEHTVNRSTWLQLQQNSEHIPIIQFKKNPSTQHELVRSRKDAYGYLVTWKGLEDMLYEKISKENTKLMNCWLGSSVWLLHWKKIRNTSEKYR